MFDLDSSKINENSTLELTDFHKKPTLKHLEVCQRLINTEHLY